MASEVVVPVVAQLLVPPVGLEQLGLTGPERDALQAEVPVGLPAGGPHVVGTPVLQGARAAGVPAAAGPATARAVAVRVIGPVERGDGQQRERRGRWGRLESTERDRGPGAGGRIVDL